MVTTHARVVIRVQPLLLVTVQSQTQKSVKKGGRAGSSKDAVEALQGELCSQHVNTDGCIRDKAILFRVAVAG